MSEIEELPNLGNLSLKADSKASDVYILNEKLDLVATALVECYEKLLSERKLLDTCLNDGYLNLSKARSQVGCAHLSIMQIPAEELKPFVTVEIKSSNTSTALDESKDIRIDYSTHSFDLQFEENDEDPKKNDEKEGDEIKFDAKSKKKYAPLTKWFGAFPSLSLRQSQTAFSNSLFIIKNIADLQAKLKSLHSLYKDLLTQLNDAK